MLNNMSGFLNYDIANYNEREIINKNQMGNLPFLNHLLKTQDPISFAKYLSIL